MGAPEIGRLLSTARRARSAEVRRPEHALNKAGSYETDAEAGPAITMTSETTCGQLLTI